MNPKYLGDAVYANFDGHHIVLTTGHHDPKQADSIIFLDADVYSELAKYVATLAKVTVKT